MALAPARTPRGAAGGACKVVVLNEQLSLNCKRDLFTLTTGGPKSKVSAQLLSRTQKERTTPRRTRTVTIAYLWARTETGHFQLRQYWSVFISQRTN